ncbi:Hypothetical protein A7982_03036 [Minicystis rosea]|nr:Hypothetical protein A7982_03036 [Minicystis rosea]
MPFFNWSSGGFAHAVASRWLESWEGFRKRRGGVSVYLGVGSVGSPQEHGDAIFLDVPGMGRAAFDLAILAVGFGIESQFPGAESSPSYWAVDDLEQEGPRAIRGRRRVLISGMGDGGLIDFVRARVRNFDHNRTIGDFVFRARHLEKRLLASGVRDDPGRIARACRTVAGDADDASLNEWLVKQLRDDTEVTLLGDTIVPFSTPSAEINRAFAIRLLENDVFGSTHMRGRLLSVEPAGARFSVRVSSRPNDELAFDQVIIRHGADSAIHRDFPDVAEMHQRHLAEHGGASEVDEAQITAALDFFAKLETHPPVGHETSARDAIFETAKTVAWHISDADVIATLRRIDPNADWATPPPSLACPPATLALRLAETLETRLPSLPRGVGDIRRLHALVRLLLEAKQPRRALDVFYGRVRGDAHRSVYDYGLYEEDRALLGELLRAWPAATEPLTHARLLNSQGFAELALGQLSRACTSLSEAASLRRTGGDWLDEATSRINLAEALRLLDKHDEAGKEIEQAVRLIGTSSHLGLYRYARARQAMQQKDAALDEIVGELWRLPDPPITNAYETVLANLSDVVVFACRIRHAASDGMRRAIANEALRHFGVTGPARRACVTSLDRAIVTFFTTALSLAYSIPGRNTTLGEALWEVERAGDLMWRTRCELCASRIAPSDFPAPALPAEATAFAKIDPKLPLDPLAV